MDKYILKCVRALLLTGKYKQQEVLGQALACLTLADSGRLYPIRSSYSLSRSLSFDQNKWSYLSFGFDNFAAFWNIKRGTLLQNYSVQNTKFTWTLCMGKYWVDQISSLVKYQHYRWAVSHSWAVSKRQSCQSMKIVLRSFIVAD